MFIIAGINSPFGARDRFSVMVNHIYSTAYRLSAEQNYFCLLLALSPSFHMFCSLSLPAPHCSVSSAPLPLISWDTWSSNQGRGVSRWEGTVRPPQWGREAAEMSPWMKYLREITKAFKLECQVSTVYKKKIAPLLTCLFHPESKWNRIRTKES